MTPAQYDAKKAALEADRADWQKDLDGALFNVARIDKELAALGPRPTERSVEWTSKSGDVWRWTYDKGLWTRLREGGYSTQHESARDALLDVPLDVALRVLLLAVGKLL